MSLQSETLDRKGRTVWDLVPKCGLEFACFVVRIVFFNSKAG